MFRNAARARPDAPAAALGDDVMTFGQVESDANRIARALLARGVRRGDMVAVWSATSLEMVPVFAALAKIGAVFAPLNPALSSQEAAETVSLACPDLVIVDEIHAGAEVAVSDAMVTFHQLSSEAAPHPDGGVAADGLVERDPHVVFFTSGSTGRPKGVVLSHRVNVLRSLPGSQLEARGAMVCPYPLFHMGAWTIALQQWQARDCVAFVERADAPSICAALDRHRAERINCIPAVWRRVLDHGVDGDRVRFADTGTSATPLDLLEAISGAFPRAQVRVFYGSTEAGVVASLPHADMRRKPGSCGVPGTASDVRIATDGELLVRGPLLCDGYYDDAVATADAFVDGWYRTGDLAEADDDGYLTIIGRTRDVLRTGGEAVAPAEIEAVIATHPGVEDVAVVGLPDVQWGEVVCAVVVPPTGKDAPTLDELREYCTGRLAPFKHPRRVYVVDAIPRTAATNQVQRRLLVEQLSDWHPTTVRR